MAREGSAVRMVLNIPLLAIIAEEGGNVNIRSLGGSQQSPLKLIMADNLIDHGNGAAIWKEIKKKGLNI